MKRAKSIQARQQKALEQKEQLLHNIDETEALTIRPLAFLKPRLLDVQDLCLCFGPNTVVKNLSFTLERGERIALCGPNGCGKSSVLKAVLGQIAPAAGQVMVPPQLKISYVSQDASFLQGNLRAFAAAHNLDESLFKAILRKMGFARTQFEKPMEDLSEGQKKKVLLACSLCEEAHLYVWDEPLNFLDIDSRAQIETLLLQKQVCLLFVEHDQNFVQAISTKQIWLNPQGEAKTIYK